MSLFFCSLNSAAADTAKLLQSYLTLWDPIDSSPSGSPIPGILQARTLEWVAISFPNTWKWKMKVKSLCRVRLLATPWIAAHQAPPSMGFSRPRVLEWAAIAFSDSLSHSIVFLYFFALIAEEGFLISPCYSLELCIQMGISFLCFFAFPFPFHSSLWLFKLTKIKNSAPQLN